MQESETTNVYKLGEWKLSKLDEGQIRTWQGIPMKASHNVSPEPGISIIAITYT